MYIEASAAAPVATSGNEGRRTYPLEDLPILAGERVLLREVRDADLEEIVSLLEDPRVTEPQLRPPPRTAEEVHAWIRLMQRRRTQGTVFCFAVRLLPDRRLVGLGQLAVQEGQPHVEWGWVLNPAVWGSGIFLDLARVLCGFAREHLDANELVARVRIDNHRAAGALAKCGSTVRSSDEGATTWRTTAAVESWPCSSRGGRTTML